MWSQHESGSCTPCWQEKFWFSSFIVHLVFEDRKIIMSIWVIILIMMYTK